MEFHLWGLEGVVGGEVNCKEKHPTLVRAVWGAHDCGLNGMGEWKVIPVAGTDLPVKQILSNRSCTALGRWVPSKVLIFDNLKILSNR